MWVTVYSLWLHCISSKYTKQSGVAYFVGVQSTQVPLISRYDVCIGVTTLVNLNINPMNGYMVQDDQQHAALVHFLQHGGPSRLPCYS